MSISNIKNIPRTSREDILPGSRSNARCTACGNVFSNPRNFDAHRRWSDAKEMSYCIDPAKAKLRLSDKGLWITESEWFKGVQDGE